jgi:hypothetical protein
MSDILTDVPPRYVGRVQGALRQIHTWNDAVHHARRMEALAGSPGRYEFELRYSTGEQARRTPLDQALATLADFEHLARQHGVDPDAVYQALGGKPVPEPEGPHVHDWSPHL